VDLGKAPYLRDDQSRQMLACWRRQWVSGAVVSWPNMFVRSRPAASRLLQWTGFKRANGVGHSTC